MRKPIELLNTALYNDANLVAYYRFEGNSNDSKGTNHGTDTNMAYSNDAGKFFQGALFNDVPSSHITIPSFINNIPMSILFWVKDALDGAQWATIGHYANESYNGWAIGCFQNKVAVIYFASQFNYAYNGSGTDVGVNFADGQKHFVCVAFTTSGIKVYVDGVYKFTQAWTGTPANATASYNIRIGDNADDSNKQKNLKLDDLAFFSREITDAEQQAVWNGAVNNLGKYKRDRMPGLIAEEKNEEYKGVIATGGSMSNDGTYIKHTFTSSGTLTVIQGGIVEVLVVGGGGGGSGYSYAVNFGGGGSGGCVVENLAYTVTPGAKTVTVGGGGGGGANGSNATAGGSSVFDAITATGGQVSAYTVRNGGSNASYNGGNASGIYGGGGAGAGGAGVGGGTGTGGIGVLSSLSGASVGYGGGGSAMPGLAVSGYGGGDAGTPGAAGTANRGGGGGAGYNSTASGAGGSGVVIVRYKIDPKNNLKKLRRNKLI